MEKKIIFDIEKNKVKGSKKNIGYLTVVAQNLLKKKFPPSFIEWLKEFGEKVSINSGKGNFSTDLLLPKKKEDDISSIVYGIKELEKAGWPVNDDFILFGSDGGENIFVFYTKFSQRDGEYPILMISLENKERPYVLMSTSFDKFINIYVKLEILRSKTEEKKLIKITNELVKKYEPRLEIDFANQLVNWDWKFSLLKDIDRKLEDICFKKDKKNGKRKRNS